MSIPSGISCGKHGSTVQCYCVPLNENVSSSVGKQTIDQFYQKSTTVEE